MLECSDKYGVCEPDYCRCSPAKDTAPIYKVKLIGGIKFWRSQKSQMLTICSHCNPKNNDKVHRSIKRVFNEIVSEGMCEECFNKLI